MISALVIKIAELFVYIFLGFALAKFRVVDADHSVILSKLSLYFLLPAAIINSFNIKLTGDILIGCALSLCSAVCIHIVFFIIDKLHTKIFKAGAVERASIMYPNAGNLVIPLVIAMLGGKWVIFCVPFLTVQLLFLWTHGVSLFSKGRVNILKSLKNPNIVAIGVGILVALIGGLPSFPQKIISSLGDMVAPISMILAGILLSRVKFRELFSDKRVYRVIAMRLIFCPLIVLALLKGFSLLPIADAENILLVSLIAALTPPASTVMQLAQINDCDTDFALSANILSTLLCIITMPLITALFLL